MKVNVKKVLFIIVCAELMIWYWAQMDFREQKGRIVYNQNNHGKEAPPEPKNDSVALKHAS